MTALDDQLQALQVQAGADAVALVLRRLVSANKDVKVRSLTKAALSLIAEEVICAYIIERARQEREYGSALLDGQMQLG